MLNADQLGRVLDFMSVPGCGLKCSVSQIETLMNGEVTDVQIMNTHSDSENTSSFTVTYHVPNEALDSPANDGQSCNILLQLLLLLCIDFAVSNIQSILCKGFDFVQFCT